MKKRFVLEKIMLLTLLFYGKIYSNNIENAISQLDIAKVHQNLKEILTQQQKEQLLVGVTRIINKYQEDTKSIFKSKSDLLTVTLGLGEILALGIPLTSLGLFSIFRAYFSIIDYEPRRDDPIEIIIWAGIAAPNLALGLSLIIAGHKEIRKGLSLGNAYKSLKKAFEIEKLIKNCKINKN